MLQLLLFRKTQISLSCVFLVKYIIVPTHANFIINLHNILSKCVITDLNDFSVLKKCEIRVSNLPQNWYLLIYTHVLNFLFNSFSHSPVRILKLLDVVSVFYFWSVGFLKSSLLSVVLYTVSCNWILNYIKNVITANPLILHYWSLKNIFSLPALLIRPLILLSLKCKVCLHWLLNKKLQSACCTFTYS